jgi:Fe-S cluster biogenesis protein NfuA/nitrite reductase/ring-hydroxylating ferredoxin subunit
MTDTDALVGRVEELTARLERIPDPAARDCAEELAGALMELYGEGLERILAAVDEPTRERLAADGVVASLMLMHGLYPVDLETRVREALASVRPYLESHGGDVELLGIADGVARLRLEGSCRGCAASASTLELGIRQALEAAAPDLDGIAVEGMEEAPIGIVELPMVQVAAPAPPHWVRVPGLERLGGGALAGVELDGASLVVARVGGDLLAYRNACAGCGARLDDALLEGPTLSCPACAQSFELKLAGRSSDGSGLQLEPVPLLRDGGEVRVALPAAAEPQEESCELCSIGLPAGHRHLLHLAERRIVCVCATCWALRSGDGDFRPVGNRTIRLADFSLSDEQWAAFQIPIGLAFFMISSVSGGVVALYPSPAGATESELDLEAWAAVCAANPTFELEPDSEALIVNRLADPPQHLVAPIDKAYGLVGVVKTGWEGISGGAGVEEAVAAYLDGLQPGIAA